jgi:hypothetical protein
MFMVRNDFVQGKEIIMIFLCANLLLGVGTCLAVLIKARRSIVLTSVINLTQAALIGASYLMKDLPYNHEIYMQLSIFNCIALCVYSFSCLAFLEA